jgi:hypothetical protein
MEDGGLFRIFNCKTGETEASDFESYEDALEWLEKNNLDSEYFSILEY